LRLQQRTGRDLSDQQKRTIDDLKGKLGVNENALKAFFATLGEKDVPTDQLVKRLVEIAGSYKDALARAAPNPNDPPEIAKVKDGKGTEAAKRLIDFISTDTDDLLAAIKRAGMERPRAGEMS
jgi:hypothetical protein